MPRANGLIIDNTHKAALHALGKKKANSQDWFDANICIVTPLIETKRATLQEYKNSPTPSILQALRKACSEEWSQNVRQQSLNHILPWLSNFLI